MFIVTLQNTVHEVKVNGLHEANSEPQLILHDQAVT